MSEVSTGGSAGSAPVFLLADDHAVVRHGLALLLEKLFDCQVIECSTAEDAVAEIGRRQIDLVFLDVRFPGNGGLWALAQMQELAPDLPVVMLSTFASEDDVRRANEGGARGYLLKEATSAQLRQAVETARSGMGLYLHPAAAEMLRPKPRAANPMVEELSPREVSVLRLVAAGATNDTIARELFVSEKTVKSHLSSILRKMGVSNRTQAASKALREGLVDLTASPESPGEG